MDSKYSKNQMPILRPVPIPTKGAGFFMAIYLWLATNRKWELMEDWKFELRKGVWIVIHTGFIFDGASIPRLLWWILAPTGILLIPGLVHDYAYRFGYLRMTYKDKVEFKYGIFMSRNYWDDMFKVIGIKVNGMKILNNLAYYSLVLFGWVAWNKHLKIRGRNTEKVMHVNV